MLTVFIINMHNMTDGINRISVPYSTGQGESDTVHFFSPSVQTLDPLLVWISVSFPDSLILDPDPEF
jgi:hypothetical protein